jgi:hypothetical protein
MLIENNEIDKFKVIEKCLDSALIFQKRTISSYFFAFLNDLSLTNEELLSHQDTLFTVLESQHSKPINQTLKYIKTIHKEKGFKLTSFTSHIPTLLAWNVKSLVNSTLILIDTLMKSYPQEKENLAFLSLEVLANEHESIQVKFLKILKKHKLLEQQNILDEIQLYADGLYHASKELLPKMEEIAQEETFEIIIPQRIRDDNKMPRYETFDEMVFFFSQVFEGNNVYDFDLFVALLPKLHKMINEDNISKLEPAFIRAINVYSFEIFSFNRNIITLMAVVFLEFAMFIKKRFVNSLLVIEKEYSELINFTSNHNLFTPMTELNSAIFEPTEITEVKMINSKITYQKRVEKIKYIQSVQATMLLDMINSNFSLIFISNPTHKTSWIEAEILIKRLEHLQNNHLDINIFDIQVALSRVVIPSKKLNLNHLNNEFKSLFLYLFYNHPLDITSIENVEFWLIAILRKENQDDIKLFIDVFSKEQKEINILEECKWNISNNQIKLNPESSIKKLSLNSIFTCSTIYNLSENDTNNYLHLAPNLPKFLFHALLLKLVEFSDDSESKKTIKAISNSLIDIWGDFGEIEYLYLAFSTIYQEKTTRTLSAELWIKATQENTMNHQLLGKTLGKLAHHEYAPLKRFTDLIIASMLNISSLHNQSLVILLSAMIVEMHDTPIKGTKKLLEIYLEVLSLTKQKPFDEVLVKLGVWGEVKSLKGIVKKIIKGQQWI